MPRQFKNDAKTASRKQDESSNDNSEFFLLSNFDQTGNSVAADIDPEILREEEEQSARQAAAVEADDQQNNDRTGKDGIKSNSRVLVDHGKRNDASGISLHDNSQLGDVSDSERDLGLLNNKSDFKMLQMAVDAAKLIEASDGDEESLLARKKDIERYLNASENSRLGDKSEQDDSQQQKQSFQFNSGYQQGDGQNSAHNLFGHNIRMNRSHDGQGDRQDPSSDLSESYSQYLRTNPESKIHQQQLRNLRQQQQQRQQQTMTGIRNTLNNVLSQEQIAAAAAAAGSGAAGSNSLLGSSLMNAPHHSVNGKRRIRLRWSEEETKALIDGCKMHGVGNWKKILTDTRYRFNNRTAVDLKDRFRTSFPEEYSRLYPNARTHKSKRKVPRIDSSSLVKINRKERRSFTPIEDQRLLEGFERHGAAWSKIQRDESLGLGDRRSTDLRDRFRNAFPERYIAAGYKGRGTPKRTLQTLPNDADDNSYIKHNLDSTGTTNSVSYPLISSLVGTTSSYGGQGDGSDRGSSSGQVPMSPTFKAAAAAFANSNIDAELADAKHQEDVMSSIKLEGLNEDDDDDDVGDTGVLTEAERREIIQRQVELEQLRMQQEEKERQQQGQNGDGGKSDSNGTSSYSKQRRSRSASPTLIAAAAAAAAAAASVTETTSDSISATNGAGDHSEVVVNDEDNKMVGKDNSADDNKSGDGKSTDNENAMTDSSLTESLYNGLFYNGSGQPR